MVHWWIENTVAAKYQVLDLLSIAKAISRLSYKPFIDIADMYVDMASMLLNFSYQTCAVGIFWERDISSQNLVLIEDSDKDTGALRAHPLISQAEGWLTSDNLLY